MIKTTVYAISNSSGIQCPAWSEEYADQEAAAEAVREALGWDEIVLSDSYSVSDSADAVSCYPTQGECDADLVGAFAPRITETHR